VKIGVFAIPEITLGRHNLKDAHLDQADKLVKAKKKTYPQIELVGEDGALEADMLIAAKDSRTDLILKDLEFAETRLGRDPEAKEKNLLSRIKAALEKEEFISALGLSKEELELISGYGFFTIKPVALAAAQDLEDIPGLLAKAVKEGGYICFLTVGDKENRSWLIKKGSTAWEASGEIHSDIQKGFIRAEIIGFDDFIAAGGENQAKQSGKMRLEAKEYLMQDGDLANFRFNK